MHHVHMIQFLADSIPNPPPKAPPGTSGMFSNFIAWAKYIGMAVGVLGLIACGIMMSAGRRNRSHLAAEGASGLLWTGAGLSVIVLAVSIVTAMFAGG